MSYTREQERELVYKVRHVLDAAGFEEAPVKRTRTTNRERYVPKAPGYRLHIGIDPLFAVRGPECVDLPQYLFVQAEPRSKKLLAAYEASLKAAGIDAVIACSRHCKRLRVWIRRPINSEDHVDPTDHVELARDRKDAESSEGGVASSICTRTCENGGGSS